MFTEESAQSEPAWQGQGEDVGLKIWRVVVRTLLLLVDVVFMYCKMFDLLLTNNPQSPKFAM